MRELEFVDQAVERARLFERIQVLALDVLDERDRDGGFVRDAPDDCGNVAEARDLRRAPAALAGDDLVALRLAVDAARVERAHDDRLDDALRLDGIRQLLQRFLPHVDARLVLAALEQIERQLRELVACGADRGLPASSIGASRREAPSERRGA